MDISSVTSSAAVHQTATDSLKSNNNTAISTSAANAANAYTPPSPPPLPPGQGVRVDQLA